MLMMSRMTMTMTRMCSSLLFEAHVIFFDELFRLNSLGFGRRLARSGRQCVRRFLTPMPSMIDKFWTVALRPKQKALSG
jgi:hypothetical protein